MRHCAKIVRHGTKKCAAINVRDGAKNMRHVAKNVRPGAENVWHGIKNVWLGNENVQHHAKICGMVPKMCGMVPKMCVMVPKCPSWCLKFDICNLGVKCSTSCISLYGLHIGQLGLHLGWGTIPTSLPESCRYKLSAWICQTDCIYHLKIHHFLPWPTP